jgi:hypothetical protein
VNGTRRLLAEFPLRLTNHRDEYALDPKFFQIGRALCLDLFSPAVLVMAMTNRHLHLKAANDFLNHTMS